VLMRCYVMRVRSREKITRRMRNGDVFTSGKQELKKVREPRASIYSGTLMSSSLIPRSRSPVWMMLRPMKYQLVIWVAATACSKTN
jgi:hypothetical protein